MHRLLENLDLHEAEQGQPKHERLRSHLLAQLTTGRLKPGESLPSELQLADALHVARNTVRQALGELEREGLICRIRGKGTFVHERVRLRLHRGLDVFALVVPETRTGFYPSLLHGFETASKSVHNQVIVCTTENDVDKQASAILQLLDKEIGGVAIVPTTGPETPAYQVSQLRQRGIPMVFCHRRVEAVQAPLVTFPFRQVGRVAGEAFVRHGHRRVALFSTYRVRSALDYEAGLREAMRGGGGDLPEEFVHYGSSFRPHVGEHEEAVLQSLERMCRGPKPPTGVMASFDSLAEMIYLLLGRLDLRVPNDISLVGFGGTWREGAVSRQLTSVTVDEAEIGRKAGELLKEMRIGDRPLDDNQEILMPLGLNAGRTLGPSP